MPNVVDEYKTIFLGERDKPWNTWRAFSQYWSFLQMCVEVCQKPQSNLVKDTKLIQGFGMPNFVNEYKTISLRKRGKPWNSSKAFYLYWSFLSICSEVSQNTNLNLLGHRVLFQGFRMPTFFDECKIIFLRKLGKP